jgi:hypothetical protein
MSTEHLREVFKWTTYGKRGNNMARKIKLKEMTSSHLRNCLKNKRISQSTRAVFGRELTYRMRRGLTDADIRKAMRVPFGNTRPTRVIFDDVEADDDQWAFDAEL